MLDVKSSSIVPVSPPPAHSTVQFVVNAIRQAGATNFLLLPGSSWASAQAFPTEAGPYLVKVTDPLGGTDKLIFDAISRRVERWR